MYLMILLVLFQALLVFILYVRCTAINPADPGIMFKFDRKMIIQPDGKHELPTKDPPKKYDELSIGAHSSPSSLNSIPAPNSSRKGSMEGSARTGSQVEVPNSKRSCSAGGIFCALFVYEDCRKEDGTGDQDGTGEDALYCTLCNSEVYLTFHWGSRVRVCLISSLRLFMVSICVAQRHIVV